MAASICVFAGFLVENVFVRAGIIDFIYLAQFGFPALILTMGLALQRQESEQTRRVMSVMNHLPSVIYMKDTSGKYMMVNQQFEALFNKSNADIVGKTDYEIFEKEQADVYYNNDQKVLHQNTIEEFEEVARHADNSLHIYHSQKYTLPDENGEPYALCGISTDITEKRLAEEKNQQNEAKFRTLFEAAGDAIFLMDGKCFIDCNSKTLEMFGCERNEILGHTPAEFSPSKQYDGTDSIASAIEKVSKALDGVPQFFEWQHCKLDGTIFDAEVSLNLIEIDATPMLQAIVRDISARRRSEVALRTIAAGVTGESGEGFYQTMVQSLGKLFAAKYAFIGLLDPADSRIVNTLAVSVDGVISDNISYSLAQTPCENVVGNDTCLYPCGVQQLFPQDHLLKEMQVESYIGTPIFNTEGNAVGLLVAMDTKEMTKQEQVSPVLKIFAARAGAEIERVSTEAYIRRMAYEDYLTGLANRAALHEKLTLTLQQVKSDGLSGAMLLIDLDHFKTINDALSHDVGDQVLKMVGQRLNDLAEEHVFMARIGGDEFVALMSNSQGEELFAENAKKFADKIVNELSKPLYLDSRILNIGASVGIVFFPQQGENELDILRRADMALYRAKNRGRGNVQFYEPELQQNADQRLQIERGLRHAIANKELSLNFQPQVNIDGEITGAETLLRWLSPELGQVGPDVFIPVAEETGLIHTIGEWVIDQSCMQLTHWKQSGIKFNSHLAVNVSAWQFANPGFVTQVVESMARHQVQPHQLVLELTETALLYDIQETIEKLALLRSKGIQIALDDFGTGYSSLAYLKDMPMDFLKIDKSFVQKLSTNVDSPLVETIIVMGQHMNLEVIAEGVETAAQRDILIELGCKKFQGYFFARPLTCTDFEKWLEQ
jgi:diguanylate cyclase (GGDEF)-like protein/PAS domain S-box-containing protein